MRLEQLKYLVTTANCKSINKAAQRLNITQPALSVAMNTLEEELQYPLLKRSRKGVLLTDAGERVVKDAQMILETIQSWYLSDQESFVLEGVIHLVTIPSIGLAFSNSLVTTLQERYPNLSIYIHERMPQYIVPYLGNTPVNIGIASTRISQTDSLLSQAADNKLKADLLEYDKRCVMLSSRHPLANKEVLNFEDLEQLTLAYYSESTDNVSDRYKKYFNQNQVYRLSSRESILQLVAKNGAVAIFPDKATSSSFYRKCGLIKSVPTEIEDMDIAYYLLYPDYNQMSIEEIRMLDVIKSSFPCLLRDDCN